MILPIFTRFALPVIIPSADTRETLLSQQYVDRLSVQNQAPKLTKAFTAKVMNAPSMRSHMDGYTLEHAEITRTYSPEAQGFAWEAAAKERSVHFMLEGDFAPYTAVLTELDYSHPAPKDCVALKQMLFDVDQVDGEIQIRLKRENLGINNLRNMRLIDGSHSFYENDANNPQISKLFRIMEVKGEGLGTGSGCNEVRTIVDQPHNDHCQRLAKHVFGAGVLAAGLESTYCLKAEETPKRFCRMAGDYRDITATPKSLLGQPPGNHGDRQHLPKASTMLVTAGAVALAAKYLLGHRVPSQSTRAKVVPRLSQNNPSVPVTARSHVVKIERDVLLLPGSHAFDSDNSVSDAIQSQADVLRRERCKSKSDALKLLRIDAEFLGANFETPKRLVLSGDSLWIGGIMFRDHPLLHRRNVREAIESAIQGDELSAISYLPKEVKGLLTETNAPQAKYMISAPLGKTRNKLIVGFLVDDVERASGVATQKLSFCVADSGQ